MDLVREVVTVKKMKSDKLLVVLRDLMLYSDERSFFNAGFFNALVNCKFLWCLISTHFVRFAL